MELSDLRTGERVHSVADEEGTLHLLGEILEAILRDAFGTLTTGRWNQPNYERISSFIETTHVLSPSMNPRTHTRDARANPYHNAPGFDCYTAANAADWPLSPSELRAGAGLADADLDALAAHLNAELRREAAYTLALCADFAGNDGRTAWDDFRTAAGLHGATLPEVADAIASGAAQWRPLCDWTPSGGAFGDPFTVCRYMWEPLQFAVKLDPHELVQCALAGDADLTLYRGVLDYGDGPQEIIWPRQQFTCCERGHRLCDEQRWPCRPKKWGRSGTEILTAAAQCPNCGAISSGSWLTFRPLESADGPLAQVERLDALSPETLAATADGLLGVPRGGPIV